MVLGDAGVGPDVSITTTAKAPVDGPFPITIAFSEWVTGFEVEDLVVGNGRASALQGDNVSYTATITPEASGVVRVDIPAGAVHDSAGIPNAGAQQFGILAHLANLAGAFTDHPIVAGVTPIKAIHFVELRARIEAVRSAAGLGGFAWTDRVLTAGVTPVRLVHLLELRSAVGAVYAAAGRAVPQWGDTSAAVGTTPIRAAHLMEVRAAVVALE